MEPQVIFDERRDEEVAVVIAFAQAKVERNARPLAGVLQELRLQLALQELILRPLIDHDWRPGPAAIFDQRGCVVFAPASPVSAEITAQGF